MPSQIPQNSRRNTLVPHGIRREKPKPRTRIIREQRRTQAKPSRTRRCFPTPVKPHAAGHHPNIVRAPNPLFPPPSSIGFNQKHTAASLPTPNQTVTTASKQANAEPHLSDRGETPNCPPPPPPPPRRSAAGSWTRGISWTSSRRTLAESPLLVHHYRFLGGRGEERAAAWKGRWRRRTVAAGARAQLRKTKRFP